VHRGSFLLICLKAGIEGGLVNVKLSQMIDVSKDTLPIP
jgi:hypothetical protein